MDLAWKLITDLGAKRWFWTAFVPAGLFIAAIAGLYIDLQHNWETIGNDVKQLSTEQQLGLLFGTGVLAVAFALLLDAMGLSILRWFEGDIARFWLFRLLFVVGYTYQVKIYLKTSEEFQESYGEYETLKSKLGEKPLSKTEIAEYQRLQSKVQRLSEKLYHYPANEEKIMPTRLGNILHAAEEYPYENYGLDPSVTWLRLYPSISTEIHDGLEGSRASLDLSIRLVLLTVIFALIATPLEWGSNGSLRAILILLTTLVIIIVLHNSAVQYAIRYGELIRTAYDLHRFDLYKALHLEYPSMSGEQEQKMGNQLNQILLLGSLKQTPIQYNHKTE